MTISSATSKNQYTGNGSNTAFTYSFKIYDEDDIRVLLGDTVKTITTDYSVSGVGSDSGGTVTFVTAPANGVVVTLKRNEPLLQNINYVDGDDFPAASHEEGLDRSVIRDQFLQEQVSRAVLFPESSTSVASYGSVVNRGVLYYDGTVIKADESTIDNLADDAAAAAASASAAAASASSASSSASSASGSASTASTAASTATTQAGIATTQATNSSSSAISAAASAVLAGSTFTTTSSTSNSIGTGNKTFTVAANKNFVVGVPIIAVDSANPANYMLGTVNSYSSTTLVIAVTSIGGSGTKTSWNISICGTKGADGAGTGDFSSNTATSVDSELVLFSGTGGKTGKRATGTGYVKVTSGVMGTPAATIPLTDLATQAANTIIANATGSAAVPSAVALGASTVLGRDSTGNVSALTLSGLTAVGGVLTASGLSVSASSLGQTGYITFSNGLKIQWGITSSLTGGGATSTVTLSTGFASSSSYSILISPTTTDQNGAQANCHTKNLTSTTFDIRNTASTCPFFYIAIGN